MIGASKMPVVVVGLVSGWDTHGMVHGQVSLSAGAPAIAHSRRSRRSAPACCLLQVLPAQSSSAWRVEEQNRVLSCTYAHLFGFRLPCRQHNQVGYQRQGCASCRARGRLFLLSVAKRIWLNVSFVSRIIRRYRQRAYGILVFLILFSIMQPA